MRYTNPRNTHSLNRITAMTSNDTCDIRFDVNYAIKSNEMGGHWAVERNIRLFRALELCKFYQSCC